MIYTLKWKRDPIPCRTTYIEYRSPVKILISFWGTPPNSTGFHCKIFFFIVLRHRSWGVPFGEPEKLIFLYNIKRNWSFRGICFFLKRSSLGTSDIQGCYSPKGITYMIYTLIHGRDPIPWRITYIEFRSPVKIFIIFWGTPPNSICFHCKICFFFIVHPAIAPAKRVATHFPCWNRSCPFAELVWITGGCSNPCFCQKPEKIFSWIKMDSRKYYMYMLFFSDSGICFYSMYRFFYRFREMFLRPKSSILYSMYPIGIIYIYIDIILYLHTRFCTYLYNLKGKKI